MKNWLKELGPVDWLQALLMVVLFVMLLFAAARSFSQECDEYGYNCDNFNSENIMSSENVMSSGDSLALGFGGTRFGAAIGDCMGTQARTYLFGLYGQQTLTESHWCEAFNLISAGYTDAGTYILCHHTVLKDMPGCPGPLLSMVPEVPPVPTVPDDLAEHYQISDTRYSELADQLARIEAQNQANAQAAANRRAEERRYAQSVITQVQELVP
jgi:hypothetical protein